jgi:hypothetical protein
VVHFTALETDFVQLLRSGGLDAHGQPPERSLSGGTGNPFRHYLEKIPVGRPILILAY